MLYLHCGASRVTEQDLKNYVVPTVEELRAARGEHLKGTRWKPVPHIELVQTIRNEAESRGLKIHNEAWGLSKDTHTIFGSVGFKHYVPNADKELGMQLGVRSDNLQRVQLYGVSGARVFICDNMAICGQFAFGRRHTTNLDLSELIHEGFDTFIQQTREIGDFKHRLQEIEISTPRGDQLLVEACHRDIIPSSQIIRVSREWREPRHDVFKERTAWSLYNCVTEIAKKWVVNTHENALREFPRMFLKDEA